MLPEDLMDEGGLGTAKVLAGFVSFRNRGGALGLRMEDEYDWSTILSNGASLTYDSAAWLAI